MSQLALDLGHRAALGREDFLLMPENAEAVAWIDRWPDWPMPTLALYGPAGCGKSHLAQVFAGKARAGVVAPGDLTVENAYDIVSQHPALALEDGDRVSDPRALLHLFNVAKERGVFLLLTAREPPARWPVQLADLRSRLATVPAISIESPSDEMVQALLVKLFSDRQITVAPDVIAYLARHMDRSFAAARSVVARADTNSLAGKRAVTIPLVRAILEATQNPAGG